MRGDIARRWKELSGEHKWKGLLDPLDNDLRRYIVHYGEMAEVTYDAFNSDRRSKYAGDSYFSKTELFARTGFLKGNPYRYKVTKFFYATSSVKLPGSFIVKSLSREAWSKESNWMGYIAVATDEGKEKLGRRDIVVAWRGTIQPYEWANDFDFPLDPASELFPGAETGHKPQIASGWLALYTTDDPRSPFNKTSAREQVLGEVNRLLEQYKDEEVSITLTGHSLGATMSTLCATDIAYNGHKKMKSLQHKPFYVTAFAFASPRVGDKNFKMLVDSIENLNILRITNVPDVVPRYPLLGYDDAGEVLTINTLKSKYLKQSLNLRNYHNIDIYLHGVAGTQGSLGGFKLEIEKDISSVNKRLDALDDEYLIPGSWWCVENKGMVQMDDGSWKLYTHRTPDDDECN
ncbi:PREDICTED: phospholipase A1-IIbeta [Tarenaya hassleriana]|uniref:phospholipase A1-IIbeta n=1 Tax=Tarenaya hassleriana TaxID=28532 RepID=UPI00053C166F|nr:PREDICTED: phospholipase A1-IIbeta [Tarenaya hassleriana]